MKIIVCFVNALKHDPLVDWTFLSSTEKTTLNIRTILPSNFSRLSLLSSTAIKLKNGIDQHDEAEFPLQVKKRCLES